MASDQTATARKRPAEARAAMGLLLVQFASGSEERLEPNLSAAATGGDTEMGKEPRMVLGSLAALASGLAMSRWQTPSAVAAHAMVGSEVAHSAVTTAGRVMLLSWETGAAAPGVKASSWTTCAPGVAYKRLQLAAKEQTRAGGGDPETGGSCALLGKSASNSLEKEGFWAAR
jgi:hypothetical protein